MGRRTISVIMRHFERGDILPKDKLLHLIAGFVIALVGTMLFDKITGLGLAVITGAAKEFYDYHNPKKHSVELLDFVATFVGGLLVFMIL